MTVCKFYREGNCRFGDKCRYEHPGSQRDSHNGGRFGVPQQSAQRVPQNTGRGPSRPNPVKSLPYALSADTIISDLTNERPQWILSAYGPGLKAPTQLFGGPLREQSFEEMRFLYYAAQASGNTGLAMQQAQQGEAQAIAQNQNAIQNVDDAIQYVLKAENEHPNRIDTCNNSDVPEMAGTAVHTTSNPFNRPGNQPAPTINPFNQGRLPQTSTFGTPALMAQRSSPWGISTSGMATMPNTINTFPAAVNNTPHFDSGSRQSASNAFNNFGGTANQGQLGGPTQATMSMPFGQTNPALSVNPFGQSGHSANAGSFGVSMQGSPAAPLGEVPLFPANGANPGSFPAPTTSFGSAAPTAPVPSAAFSAPFLAGPSSRFATTTSADRHDITRQTANPLTPNAFSIGASSSMDTDTRSSNPFEVQKASNSLGMSMPDINPSANGASQVVATGLSMSHPPIQSYASHDGNGRLSTFNGRRVQYRDGCPGIINRDGAWEKIWFPEGPPAFNNTDTQVDEDAYDRETVAAYENLKSTGAFVKGFMPLQPPKREWCLWDF